MKQLSAAANTVVPGVRALEDLGFEVTFPLIAGEQHCRAKNLDHDYLGPDPIYVLGLVKLIEMRGWDGWRASDAEVEAVLARMAPR